MSAPRTLSACLLGLFCLLLAQGADANEFKRCQDLYASNQHDAAYVCYKALWDAQKGYDVAANLGNVEVQLGKYKEAVVHLTYVLDNLPLTVDNRDVIMQKTREKLADAKRHVAVIRLNLTPVGATVTLNGAVIGTTPLVEPLILDPGNYQLAAQKPGYADLRHGLIAQANTEPTLNLDMVPGESSLGSGKRGMSPARIAVAVVGGVIALGAIGAGIGLHVAAGGKADDREAIAAELGSNSACTGAGATDPRCTEIQTLADDEATFSTTGTALLIAGGVLAAGTVVAVIVWPSSSDSAALGPELWFAPSLGGLTVGGRF